MKLLRGKIKLNFLNVKYVVPEGKLEILRIRFLERML